MDGIEYAKNKQVIFLQFSTSQITYLRLFGIFRQHCPPYESEHNTNTKSSLKKINVTKYDIMKYSGKHTKNRKKDNYYNTYTFPANSHNCLI